MTTAELKMTEIRCKNPHPRLVGKPCNAMVKMAGDAGQVTIECWRCHGHIHLNFDKLGTESIDKSN